MPMATRIIFVAISELITSIGFSSSPKRALYMGSSKCSNPNTLPNTSPKNADEIPHGASILPIAIFLILYINIPTTVRQIP